MRRKIRVGLVGCGAIGTELARILVRKFSSHCRLTCLHDLNRERALGLARSLRLRIRIAGLLDLVRNSDFVIEAASAQAVGPVLRAVLARRKHVLIMSVGGLFFDGALARRLNKSRGNVYLPSGALAGVDGLLAAKMGRIRSVSLTTRKPARAFEGSPYLVRKGIDVSEIRKETLLFQGSARQAVRAFPQNINVAALLSLAGVGPDRTRVRIYASPNIRRNVHQVEVEGNFGRIFAVTENVPSERNPKTSLLAALSPAALLAKIFSALKVGT